MRIILTAAVAALALGGVANARGSHRGEGRTTRTPHEIAIRREHPSNRIKAPRVTEAHISRRLSRAGRTVYVADKAQPTIATAPMIAETRSARAPTSMATDRPAGATAQCRDGAFSAAASHSGTCSHHGGVAEFFN